MGSVTAVIAWYGSGFLVARRLIGRGHSAVVWWSLAALLGGLTVVPAVFSAAWRRRSGPGLDVVGRPVGAISGLHVMVVGAPERLLATLDAVPPAVARHTGPVTIVGIVGHEAFSGGLDTGERPVAADTVRSVRPCSRSDNRVVTTQGVDGLEAVVAGVGVPDLLVSSSPSGGAPLRRSLRDSLEASARHDLPVLLVPRRRSTVPSGRPAMKVVA